jgi:hypothetical protein
MALYGSHLKISAFQSNLLEHDSCATRMSLTYDTKTAYLSALSRDKA